RGLVDEPEVEVAVRVALEDDGVHARVRGPLVARGIRRQPLGPAASARRADVELTVPGACADEGDAAAPRRPARLAVVRRVARHAAAADVHVRVAVAVALIGD